MLKLFYTRMSPAEGETGVFRKAAEGKTCREKECGSLLLAYALKAVADLNPQDYHIVKGEHGKPYLAGTEMSVYFNISHSGDYVVCAVSDSEVGIDLQKMGVARMPVASRFFHPSEYRMLEDSPHRDELFFICWTVKEAYLKYSGCGLSRGLSSFEVRAEDGIYGIWEDQERMDVCVSECRLVPGYKCFVCSAGPEVPEVIHVPLLS